LTGAEVEAKLRQVSSLRQAHFVFKSGRHCESYCRPDDLIPHQTVMWELAREVGRPYLGEVQAVMGAHFGGNALAQLVAARMCTYGYEVLWIPTLKIAGDEQVVEPERDFELHLPGKVTLVVDDVTATGGTPGRVVQLARGHGSEVVGVSAIASYCDNEQLATRAGVERADSLLRFQFTTYDEDECPMCASEEPVVIDKSLGHGWEFKLDYPDYPGGWIELLAA
jgi:orotate phosphoribosyltransferase